MTDSTKSFDPSAFRARRRFTGFTWLVSIALLSWGAFVTSINAGLAVPDWPTSFRSYDPFNPWPDWWTITPILAEHGHRLLGALVGLLTVVLAIWTWVSDHRTWMKRLGIATLVLVVLQGVLGGLRVVWVSLDLAMIHAGVAQLYFSLLACMILFVSPTWLRAPNASAPLAGKSPRNAAVFAVLAVYVQILLGALLRHPGTGIAPLPAGLHIGFAFVAAGAVVYAWTTFRTTCKEEPDIRRLSSAALTILCVQIVLGLFAYFVLLDEKGLIEPGNVQVVVNSAHLVVGAILLASLTTTAALVVRRSRNPAYQVSAGCPETRPAT